MSRVLIVFLLALLPAAAQVPQYWHRVSGSVGWFVPAAGWETYGYNTSPVVSLDYGFRFNRYGQWDAGWDAAFPNPQVDYKYGTHQRTNIYIPRTGYSVVVPVWRDRIEASAGAGGAYVFYKPHTSEESWLIYVQASVKYALDRDLRYHAGTFARWYRDPIGHPTQQWVAVGAQFTYAFGR